MEWGVGTCLNSSLPDEFLAVTQHRPDTLEELASFHEENCGRVLGELAENKAGRMAAITIISFGH